MNDASDETPLADLLAAMSLASMEVSSLDPERLMLVRIAALIAVDAPPASYLLNLDLADAAGIDGATVRDVFAAVAPIVGTARVASAVGKVARALGFVELLAEQQLADDDLRGEASDGSRGWRMANDTE